MLLLFLEVCNVVLYVCMKVYNVIVVLGTVVVLYICMKVCNVIIVLGTVVVLYICMKVCNVIVVLWNCCCLVYLYEGM